MNLSADSNKLVSKGTESIIPPHTSPKSVFFLVEIYIFYLTVWCKNVYYYKDYTIADL